LILSAIYKSKTFPPNVFGRFAVFHQIYTDKAIKCQPAKSKLHYVSKKQEMACNVIFVDAPQVRFSENKIIRREILKNTCAILNCGISRHYAVKSVMYAIIMS